jgi:dsRNA-specific ribonuclease
MSQEFSSFFDFVDGKVPFTLSALYRLDVLPQTTLQDDLTLGFVTYKLLNVKSVKMFPGDLFAPAQSQCRRRHPEVEEYDPSCCIACNHNAVWISPVLVSQQEFSQEQASKLKAFHFFMFSSITRTRDMLKYHIAQQTYKFGDLFGFNSEADSSQHLCVVPCSLGGGIHWGVVEAAVEYFVQDFRDDLGQYNCFQGEDPMSYTEVLNTVLESRETGELMMPLRADPQGILLEYRVNECQMTVQDYYLSHGTTLRPQAVLHARQIGKFMNALRPRFHIPPKDIVIPPEIYRKFPLPLSLISLGRLIPFILDQLLQIDKAATVSQEFSLDRTLTKEALTCVEASETANYERLEFLGDTILKFLVSIKLFPSGNEEGALTIERSTKISNKNLAKIALKLRLHRFIRARPLNLRNWVPPGFIAQHFVTEAEDCEELTLKQLADVVEALIGVSYLTEGFQLAFATLVSLGILNPSPGELHSLPDQKDFSGLYEGLSADTPNIGWISEAFLHASLQKSRSYQRLEFLGDALVDMVVVDYIYKQHPQATPEVLTLLKERAVNNRAMAEYSLKLGLHKWIVLDKKSSLASSLNRIDSCTSILDLADAVIKVLADLFESFCAGLMLVKGLSSANKFIRTAVCGNLQTAHRVLGDVRAVLEGDFWWN